MRDDRREDLLTQVSIAEKHTRALAAQIFKLHGDWRRPGTVSSDPRKLQEDQMMSLSEIMKIIYADLEDMALIKIDTTYKSFKKLNDEIVLGIKNIHQSIKETDILIVAAIGALRAKDSNEAIFTTRARLRSETIDSLTDLGANLRGFAETLSWAGKTVAREGGDSSGPQRTA